MNCKTICFILWFYTTICKSDLQTGPDPWHYEGIGKVVNMNDDLPPDLKMSSKKVKPTEPKLVYGEWWFKRLLVIMLKSGKIKKNEEGDIDISLQMRFDEEKWKLLDECLKSESTLTDDMFRRTVGYVENAIYKPTITEQIVMAWSDYIQVYLTEYKMYITWLFGTSGAIGLLIFLWKHMSHKHVFIIIFVLLYMYEVFTSYKELEKKEYETFVSALNTCKWYFWTNECEIPAPDPIIFLKQMNPIKIVIRMFTTMISEPMVAINATIKILLQDITDGLWFPFDKIVYGLLIVLINISLIYLLIMIVFNFIFNIPFSLNLLGIISIGIKQNRSSLFSTVTNEQRQPQINNSDTDRISGERLDRLLNVCSLALNNVQDRSNNNSQQVRHGTNTNQSNYNIPKLKRSASTGRLPNNNETLESNSNALALYENLRRRYNHRDGGGDN